MSDSSSNPLVQSILLRLRKALAYLLLLVLVGGGCWEAFAYMKLHLALRRAHREFSNREFMRAEFWTGRAFSVDRVNIEATRLMAEINEAQDKPEALRWRILVAQRAPGNAGDIMAWAKSAFRFGQREMAFKALKSLPAEFQNQNAEYHELMAGCALAGHDAGLAEEHFLKAAELDHANPVHRVNLAAFRLTNSSRSETRAAAARDLEAALADPHASLFAARALLFDAVRRHDRSAAQRFAEKLRSIPEHNFGDDLSCLEVIMGEPAFRPALTEIEHRAESDAPWTIEMGNWLNSHGMAAETLHWFAQLPEATQSNIRLQMAVAESYLTTADWNGLVAFLEKRHWDDGEFLRRAMIIRAKRESSQPWEKEWSELVTTVEANPPDGFLLAQVTVGWRWRAETIQLLWGAANRPATNSLALQSLWDLYSQTNETREMLRVVKAQLDLDPSNATKKNNTAFLSLLLYGASEGSERLAREAFTSNPKVPEWAATYAYALHLGGKESAAKKVINELSPEARARPGIALYCAIVQAANGDDAQARESLAKLDPRGMLSEERKLAADLAQQLKVASR
ncbi:MAG: hypothetical protein ABJF10_06135 [Chthoniobacter sp.]|uniref:hypothetical protein n=1 Tax=Chthoniobacter sp. TaxID=2510640 RepID=UPI0032A346B4